MSKTKYLLVGKFEMETSDMVYGSPVTDAILNVLNVHPGLWKVWMFKDNSQVYELVALHCHNDLNIKTNGYNNYIEAYKNKICKTIIDWEDSNISCENQVVLLYDAKNYNNTEQWCKAYRDLAAKYGAMTVKSGVVSKTFNDKTVFNVATFKFQDKISGVRVKFG